MTRLVAALCGAIAVATCQSSPQAPVIPTQAAGGAPVADEVAQACGQWRRLKCEEGDPTSKGASCEDVARNAAAAGIDTTPPVGCMRAAKDCAQMRACER